MNIYDIAKMAGVSIATVSRVVNGSPKVSEKTRKRVLDIIDEYGYTPNAFAQGLGLNTMHTIGILVPSISDMYMANAVFYLEQSLHERGYECILSCSGYQAAQKESHLQMLLSKKTDALILVGSTYAGSDEKTHNTDYIKRASEEVPVFLINGLVKGDNIFCTATNDRQAIFEATTGLIESGRKRILFMTDSRSYSAKQKKKGYYDALKAAGLTPDKDLEVFIQNDVDIVRRMMEEYDKMDVDAIVSTDDAMAIGALKYMLQKGKRVPDDVSIIGYNNSSLCICTTPELTSIDNKVELVSKNTVDRLIAVLQGEKKVSHKQIFDCELVKRETTSF
ncbi:MAG: LacI family DNA-binding transcriptional regulator [Eubacterium sp.]|nr:LacI family DNA-binding transcriptional regulator [Eubacterium sp.]